MGELSVKVLRGVNLTIYQKELLIINGESGSGKSTLMNIIGGIDSPTEGEVHFQDIDLTHLNEHELTQYRRTHVGFVFQFYNLVPSLTALENVMTATEIADDPMCPEKALEMVDLGDRKTHFPSQLSGGQQQRVAIARAIAKNPKLLLCDEPTGALDHENTLLILELLQKINQQTGTTIIMITHAPAIVQMANRAAVIEDGLINKIKVNESPKKALEINWSCPLST